MDALLLLKASVLLSAALLAARLLRGAPPPCVTGCGASAFAAAAGAAAARRCAAGALRAGSGRLANGRASRDRAGLRGSPRGCPGGTGKRAALARRLDTRERPSALQPDRPRTVPARGRPGRARRRCCWPCG